MKNVTITLDDGVMTKARIEAARQGKSLSRFVSDLVEQRPGRTLTSREAMGGFLSGPLMDLTDEHGNAPTRDTMYDTDQFFVDMNGLIYARDLKSAEKRRLAQTWLTALADRDVMRPNLQVPNELTRWLLANERTRPLGDIREEIELLKHWGDQSVTPDDVEQVWTLREALGFQWFDCLLVASAARLGCRFFLTEDTTDHAAFGPVTLVNPFRIPPADLLQPH